MNMESIFTNSKQKGDDKMRIMRIVHESIKKINKPRKLFIQRVSLELFTIIFILILVGFIKNVSASIEPPDEGDWIIENGEEAVLTKNHTMLGNVYIDGTLIIDGNYTLEFDCNYFSNPVRIYSLYVNNTGKLTMKNGAVIKAKAPTVIDMRIPCIYIVGLADIQNSEINGLFEGLYCEKSSNVTILNTTFRNCIHAIVGRGVKAPDDPSNNFIKVRFKITQWWYIKIKPINEKGDPIHQYHSNWGIVNLTSRTYYMFSLGLEYRQYMKDVTVSDELLNAFKDNGVDLFLNLSIVKKDEKNWEIISGEKEYRIEDTGTELKIFWQGINYTHRVVNGTANFESILVKEGSMDFNPFTMGVGVHVDTDDMIAWRPPFNGTPHLRHIEFDFNFTQNYWENPKEIVIPKALDPDFSIRNFYGESSLMKVDEVNRLSVFVRNMGEESSKASITFFLKLENEEDYTVIDTIEEEIPGKIRDHYTVVYDWKPKKEGKYNLKVEISPKDGIDPYPIDDNSPSAPINITVLQPVKIEITKIDEEEAIDGMTTNGWILIEGTFKGSYDWIHLWLNDKGWKYLFSLDSSYGQYLKSINLSEEIRIAFKDNNYTLSGGADKINREYNIWIIRDGNKEYKIENTGRKLKVYRGLFTMPYKIDYENNTWKCLLDSGAFYGKNQKIYANISGNSGMFYDEDLVTVNLNNKPYIEIISPKKNEILKALMENDEKFIGGLAWKIAPNAPDIKFVELIINGIKGDVILEKKNKTYWKWHFDWNIASKIYPVKDGQYIIRVQCTDNDQRKSEIVEITISVDNRPPYSMITIPKIDIITKDSGIPINKKILIKGVVEDDLKVKKLEMMVNNGDWVTLINNIDKNKYDWEYTWKVENLDKGIHTIYFRAVDEEDNKEIIEQYYPIASFKILKTKAILPDLSIVIVKIKNENGIETTKFRNGENLIFDININVEKPDRIKQQTVIYVKLTTENKTLGVVDKTIDKTISESFTVSISWTVYGEKGIYDYTVEIDLGNALEEENENNNIENIQIEILDSPPSDLPPEEETGFDLNMKIIMLGIIFFCGIILIFFIFSYHKKLRKDHS